MAVNDITGERAEATAEAIRAAGGTATAHAADVVSAGGADALVAGVVAEHGALHIAVNNVGMMGGRTAQPFLEQTADDARGIIERNLLATYLSCLAEARSMTNGGVILNVSSGEATRPSPMIAAYGAAKAGIDHLTRTLAVELGPRGVRVERDGSGHHLHRGGGRSDHPGGVRRAWAQQPARPSGSARRARTDGGVPRLRPGVGDHRRDPPRRLRGRAGVVADRRPPDPGRAISIVTPIEDLAALEQQARETLPHMVWEYLDSGAGDDVTAADNVAAWRRLRLRPRVLRDVSAVDTSTTVLGTRVASPVIVAPTALHRMFHDDGEIGVAHAAADTVLVVSVSASTSLEDIAAAAPATPRWLQLYMQRDRALTADLCARAAETGCAALVVTVDSPVLSRRPRNERAAFAPPAGMRLPQLEPRIRPAGDTDLYALVAGFDAAVTFDDLALFKEWSGLPIVVKGVLRGDDAARCRGRRRRRDRGVEPWRPPTRRLRADRARPARGRRCRRRPGRDLRGRRHP